MTRRNVFWTASVALIAIAGLWFATAGPGSAGSSLSAETSGWLAARRVVERVVAAEISDRPIEAGDGVLVLVFPWQRGLDEGERNRLTEHLRDGGDVVLAYADGLLLPHQNAVFDLLGIDVGIVRDEAPLAPWQWWEHQKALWTLTPSDDLPEDAPELQIPALTAAPIAPDSATVLYRNASDETLVFTFKTQRGRVIFVPARTFSNAHLLQPGHADLLVTLATWLDRPWIFNEYHHGLIAPELIGDPQTGFAWDLFVAHLVLIYLLAVWAAARKFGPTWSEPLAGSGSAATFLRNLGALHRRLGHQRDAAIKLVERAVQLDPRLADAEEELLRQAEQVENDADWLMLARAVSGVDPSKES